MKHLKNKNLYLNPLKVLCSLALMISIYTVDHPCLFFIHQPKISEEFRQKVYNIKQK